MENRVKVYNRVIAILIFIGLPILFWALADVPFRSNLKEIISIAILISFSLMLGQFYLARSNREILKGHKMNRVIKYHKVIGYIFVPILLIHPFLLVLPRYFESGIDPKDAFITMISTLSSFGIVLGMIAWLLIFVLAMLSIFRNQLPFKYKTWRFIHGFSSIVFIVAATWHAINLGRHTDLAMSVFMIVLAAGGVLLLFRTYFFEFVKKQSNGKLPK